MGNIKLEDSVENYYNYLLKTPSFASAIIAGGYIRDLHHDKEPSDVDIYIQDPAIIKNKSLSEVKTIFCADNIKVISSRKIGNSDHFYADTNIIGVLELTVAKVDRPIQIIIISKDPEQYVLENFNVGLSKCYLKGKTVHYSNMFLHDSKHKTFTINSNLSYVLFERTLSHYIPKIQHKYQYLTVIPPTLNNFHEVYLRRLT